MSRGLQAPAKRRRAISSAAMLIQKAKQFDTGVCAVEIAAEEGQGNVPSKSQLLR
jgi:hypothetical protein